MIDFSRFAAVRKKFLYGARERSYVKPLIHFPDEAPKN